jgi:hypothetical protein
MSRTSNIPAKFDLEELKSKSPIFPHCFETELIDVIEPYL